MDNGGPNFPGDTIDLTNEQRDTLSYYYFGGSDGVYVDSIDGFIDICRKVVIASDNSPQNITSVCIALHEMEVDYMLHDIISNSRNQKSNVQALEITKIAGQIAYPREESIESQNIEYHWEKLKQLLTPDSNS